MKPYYEDKYATIFHGDCLELLPDMPKVDLVLTDPPYPNGANHFTDDIKSAISFCKNLKQNSIVFWDEMTIQPIKIPLVARHIWHRTNTNRPDNYEAIYHYNLDSKKRASRVFPYPVIYLGLTGCVEATGHPTQKNVKLMKRLIDITDDETILDPFMGSGTTLVAAKQLNRNSIGIEIEEKYCEIAAQRLSQEVLVLA